MREPLIELVSGVAFIIAGVAVVAGCVWSLIALATRKVFDKP